MSGPVYEKSSRSVVLALLCLSALHGSRAWAQSSTSANATSPSAGVSAGTLEESLRSFDREEKEPALPDLPDDTSLDDKPVVNVSGPLNLTQCIELAERRNPTFLTARAELRRLYHAYKFASSIPSTTLTYNHVNGSGPAGANTYSGQNPDNYLTLQQNFFPLGSFKSQRKEAMHDYYTGRANLKAAEVTLKQNVKDGFFTVIDSQAKLRIAKQNTQFAEHIFDIASKRFDAGAGPRLDLLTAEVQRNLARQTELLAGATLAQSSAQLAPLLGLAGHAPLELDGDLREPNRHYVYTALLALARRHPQVEAAREALAKAQETVDYNDRQSNPTPGIFAIYDMQVASYQLGLSLSVPFSWGQIGYTTKQSKDVVREQELAVQNATQTISSNLQANFSLYVAATKNADLFAHDILGPQEAAANITSLGFTKGALSYTALLQVQQNLVQVRSTYMDVLLSVHTSFDALEAAAGSALDLEPNGGAPVLSPAPATAVPPAAAPPATVPSAATPPSPSP